MVLYIMTDINGRYYIINDIICYAFMEVCNII